MKKEIYKELKAIETEIMETGFRGWIGHTNIKNPHIMKLLVHLGAVPFNLVKDDLFFVKNRPQGG